MDESRPILTVVVPLYNGARYIEQTLTSIQRQTLRGIEVIVIDDGSTDGGRDIVCSHPLSSTLAQQEHLGVAVARNRGLSLANGRWVTFLDQDDLWHPTHTERLLSWLSEHPGERIVFSSEIAFSAADEVDGLLDADHLVGAWASVQVTHDDTLEQLIAETDVTGSDGVRYCGLSDLMRGPVSVTTSFIAERALLQLAGGFAPHALAMDDYWLLVNVARLQRIAVRDQPTVFYRVHMGATSRTTQLGLPFLSSAVALRLGGGLSHPEDAIVRSTAGDLHQHLLGELLVAPEYRRSDFRRVVRSLAVLLWPPGGSRKRRLRALAASRMPWLRDVVRALRVVPRISKDRIPK